MNIYPDYSHACGAAHRNTVGVYDVVISTKTYDQALWHDLHGYRNQCLDVPQGYDPLLHLVLDAPGQFEFDVVMVATYRPEYGRLMVDFTKDLADPGVRVAIGGFGSEAGRSSLASHWFSPALPKGAATFQCSGREKVALRQWTGRS